MNVFVIEQLDELKIGSTFHRINIAQIVGLLVPVAPDGEQERLARQLAAEAAVSQRPVDAINRQNALLNERRQASITAAITGELDLAG